MHSVRIAHTVRSAQGDSSPRVLEAALMFGLGVDEYRDITIIPPVDIPLPAGGIVFITGPSGGGKSTILRLIRGQLDCSRANVLDLATLGEASDAPIVDQLGRDLRSAASLLALVGLGDAFVMLRRPHELSDGQRARFNIARLIERADSIELGCVMMIDEFAATLDRLTAFTIAASLRRWITPTQHTLIVATTHDDLLEPLAPDVLVCKHLGDQIEVVQR